MDYSQYGFSDSGRVGLNVMLPLFMGEGAVKLVDCYLRLSTCRSYYHLIAATRPLRT